MPQEPRHRGGGPKTPGGKARSSQNALKHGLLSRRVLLADEDPAEFEAHVLSYRDHFRPVGPVQNYMVDKLIALSWRAMRVQQVEGASMDQTYSDTLPVLKALPEKAKRERALVSTVCNENVHTIRRYGVGADREYTRTLHELLCQQYSDRTGVPIIPGALRVSLSLQSLPDVALDQ